MLFIVLYFFLFLFYFFVSKQNLPSFHSSDLLTTAILQEKDADDKRNILGECFSEN